MYELTGKYAVVTGASSGIGENAAIGYAKAGANVAVLARRLEKLEALKEKLESYGVKAIAVKCDVANEESVKEAAKVIFENFPRVDILFNNAGIAVHGDVVNLSEEDWNKSFDINVKGIYFMSKYILPNMIENKYGKIINTASVNAVISDKSEIFVRHSYNASKKAVVGLTEAMATYYGKYNITVNAIGPGLFKSEMTEGTLFKSEEFLNAYNAANPMGRPGELDELNGPILFFSSDASSYVTGQFIVVDGAISLT
ncbi:SDR family NAD(P)-dependent oxidoreductase [Anaerosphaera multitolerans]|uniref:SDR family oxidoreductase n=1 Tax=Anaerosphaera multitolerans TaxID=2487351 RepID=A0A437S689_9FIRM|nr:SDR family oxidoreductase [Anaerosphaera multitolerans]RVU54519.1 SDR family oxidoreductase [Anaerosphaera multitolerans]